MNRKLWGICWAGLTLCNCAADPRYEPRSASQDSVLDNHRKPGVNIEAPRRLISSMQACAEQHAPKMPGESFAVLFELEVGKNGNTIRVKDSMLNGNALEICLVHSLELMDESRAASFQPNVSPQSRSMIGVVQAAAAPIALLPIALAAAGVTILVGVTIYVAAEVTKDDTAHCKEVKEDCIVACNNKLPTGDFGFRFWNCVNRCMRTAGC